MRETRMFTKVSGLVLIGLMLAGCSSSNSTPNPQPTEDETARVAIETVKERFETDCLLNLGDDVEYRYESSSGANSKGIVFASVNGVVISFSVGEAPGGAFLTVPSDESSVSSLELAGC